MRSSRSRGNSGGSLGMLGWLGRRGGEGGTLRVGAAVLVGVRLAAVVGRHDCWGEKGRRGKGGGFISWSHERGVMTLSAACMRTTTNVVFLL